ncbi:autotransporter-associated beta strand repeat-containing protein [Kiritimatiellaeota bacterium B1221]|nr:autotransporter-associated beta strand repeat-containing protein [Kiritimatiellaeota bacterium B1221]
MNYKRTFAICILLCEGFCFFQSAYAQPVTLGGIDTTDTPDTLQVSGVGGESTTVDGVILEVGRSSLESARSSGSGTFTLNVGSITREVGAVMDISTSNSEIQTTNINTNGILGGWATTGNGKDFVTVDGSGNLVTYTGYTDLSGAGTSQSIVSDATSNIRITDNSESLTGMNIVNASTTVTVADTSGLAVGDVIVRATGIPSGATIVSIDSATTFTISSPATADGTGISGEVYDPVITLAAGGTTDVNTIIRQYGYSSDSVDTPRSIEIGTGNTLRLGQYGAILRAEVTESSGYRYPKDTLTINGGVLTAGGADNTDGEIVFSSNGRHTNSDGNASRNSVGIEVNSEIQNNGTGVVSVVIDSDQGIQFSGISSANTYSGGTYITSGRLISAINGNIGTGDVIVHSGGTNGGQLYLQGGGTYANDMFISGHGYEAGVPAALALDNDTSTSGKITLQEDAGIFTQGTSTISGEIDGAGHQVTFYGTGNSNTLADLTLTNTSSDFSGGVVLRNLAGRYTSGSRFDVRIGGDGLVFGDTELVDGASSRTGQSSTYLSLEGHDLTIGGLTSSFSGRTYIQNNDDTVDATLTVGYGNTGTAVYGGDNYILDRGAASLSLIKTGSGTQELGGNNIYTGSTTVNEGRLIVSGSLTATSGVTANAGGTFEYSNASALDRDVTVNSGGTFVYNSDAAYAGSLTQAGGSISGAGNFGSVTLGGTGSIDPGNSPGILTADSFDPSGGLGANFEFTLANGDPTWSNASASGNDVLRLTSGSDAFTSALDGSNSVGIYLNLASVSEGDVFTGGFYTDLNSDFLTDVSAANYQYFVLGDGSGTHTYNGVDYYTLAEFDGLLSLDVSTRQVASADFASGAVTDGYISEYTVTAIPEISTFALLAVGLGSVFLLRRKR